MRIVFIGNVEFSYRLLSKLIALKVDIVGVVTKEFSDFNSDFVDLTEICKANDIPCKYIKNVNDDECVTWIKNLNSDIIFCFGFSQILKKAILDIPTLGVLGYHPAALPKNRGRHPIIWALALGLEETASTFFFMDSSVDSGDIISQKLIQIEYEDEARTVYDKIVLAAENQIQEILPLMEENKVVRFKQNITLANVWRKRSKADGEISFKMSSRSIYNLVRALTKPYVGAHVSYRGKDFKIWKVQEVNVECRNIEPGKVLYVNEKDILVKCSDQAILLKQHEFNEMPKEGEYL